MTLAITHPFVSAKGDGTDATLVRPSNWNAAHATSMATASVLGRQSAGTGVIEELPLTAIAAAALAAADGPSFLAALGVGGFETGDMKWSIQPTAATGWIAYNGAGTIGDASSSATVRANADCSALFQLVWNQIADADCAVPGGRGANAAADWAAHKQINLPQFSGRTVIGAGTGTSLTARTLAHALGEETHQLLTAELASHQHSVFLRDPGHSHAYNGPFGGSSSGINPPGNIASLATTGSATTGITIGSVNGVANDNLTASQGSGTAHNNMQPSVPMWAKVKL